jgi:[ribosomal protein S5]-alanine N-acetyltransferase
MAQLPAISRHSRYTASLRNQQLMNLCPLLPARYDGRRMTIHSERLDLVSLTPEFMQAILRHEIAEAERLLGVPLPADWSDCERLLSLRLAQLEADPAIQPWLLRAIVCRNDRLMIGRIGFHEAPGPPHLQQVSPGAAEFGFEVFESFRRQGFAREASLALMQWATQTHGVTRFVLTIRPDNAPSQALAARMGFKRIGEHIDEIDGLEDILELRVEQKAVGKAAPQAIGRPTSPVDGPFRTPL